MGGKVPQNSGFEVESGGGTPADGGCGGPIDTCCRDAPPSAATRPPPRSLPALNDSTPPRTGCATHSARASKTKIVDLERRHDRLLTEIDGLNERIEAALRGELGDAA